MSLKKWILLISCVLVTGLVIDAKKRIGTIVLNENIDIRAVELPAPCTISNEEDWALFIHALAWVESRWNTQAVGTSNDVGWLQCTPIIVQDANEILGYEYFSLNDRYFREKSIEIFDVVMNARNPERDKHFALKIWNSKAPVSYHTKVMNKYYELLNEYYDENHSEN